MTFTCPHCQKKHRLPEGVTLSPNSTANCKKCGRRFLLTGEKSDLAIQKPPAPESRTERADQTGDEIILPLLETFPELRELAAEKFLLDEIFSPAAGKSHPANLPSLLVKLLIAAAPLLTENILQKDESVHLVASGIAYFPFEIPYANGLLTCHLNHYALVATNQRLIFINLDYRLSGPSRFFFQVPYENISRVSRGFYGSSMIITTVAGRTWDFTTVNRRLAMTMEKFIHGQLEQVRATGSEEPAFEQLCPACFQPVSNQNLISCPYCATAYKSPRVAMKKSLLLPGTGNIYLSNSILGIIEILGYLFTWMMTIILVIIGIPGGIMGGGVLVLIYHGMAAVMAKRMGEKGYQRVAPLSDGIFQ